VGDKPCFFNADRPRIILQMPSSEPDKIPPPPRKATLWEVVAAVVSSFLGIRKGKAMREDAVAIKPHQVVLVGVVLAAIFVISLILIVRLIIRAAEA
jgi:hypothetical protein